MRIIAVKILGEFWLQPKYSDSEKALKAWFAETKCASWKTTQDIKSKYRDSSFLADNSVFLIFTEISTD